MAATPDHLFSLRNNFYLGAYQAAINTSDLPILSHDDSVERDCLVYRSYIALGSYQVGNSVIFWFLFLDFRSEFFILLRKVKNFFVFGSL